MYLLHETEKNEDYPSLTGKAFFALILNEDL